MYISNLSYNNLNESYKLLQKKEVLPTPPLDIKPEKTESKNIFQAIKDIFTPSQQLKQIEEPHSGSVDDIKDKHTKELLSKVPDYVNELDKRHENADPVAKAIYDRYEPEIKLATIDEKKDPANYKSDQKAIFINATEDLNPKPVPGSTFYHEVGHFIDNKISNSKDPYEFKSSLTPEFTEALRNDFENYITQYMKDKHLTRKQAEEWISVDMLNHKHINDYKGVSDIYGGLSDCKVQGLWGHSKDYWKQDGTLAREAFADMFNAAMDSPEEVANMRKMLPTSYELFHKMIEEE